MSGQPRVFRCPATGVTKEFAASSYIIDQTNMHSRVRESKEFHFYRAADGTRIDEQPDGSYLTKHDVVWVPAEKHRR